MRTAALSLAIALALGLTLLLPAGSRGELGAFEPERWDLRMIREAPVWQKLLVNYGHADYAEVWPERKEALRSVLEEHPDSAWADDAALLLAGGRASLENDVDGAIADLRRIVEDYPDGQTVVDRWDRRAGCRFDETWLMWQGGLVYLEPDGAVRAAKPFDVEGEIAPPEREALTYFGHLERYPRATSVMARLFIAEMQVFKGDRAGALGTLRQLASGADAYLHRLAEVDRAAARRPDGYLIRRLGNRPEYRAYVDLVRQLEKAGREAEAAETAGRFLERYSADGWLWPINRSLARLFERRGMAEAADRQYELALQGLAAHESLARERVETVGSSDLPDDYWQLERAAIEASREKTPGGPE